MLSNNSSVAGDRFAHPSSLPSSPSRNGTISKKRPVPTPRTILNTTADDTVSFMSESAVSANSSNILSPSNPATSKYSPIDRIILQFAQFVIDPNQPDDYCPICSLQLDSPSPCSNEADNSVVCLTLCQHKSHLACLKSLIENQVGGASYIECPKCKVVSGEKWGDMPSDGGAAMTFKIVAKGLPGYESYHTIQVTYNFSGNGVQGPNHPKPGQPYYTIGFPRTAFLPDTERGRKCLKLLETAFHRQLTFTIARGSEQGEDDLVVWNKAIEHKTEFGPSEASNAFPDADYLDRLQKQLEGLGIGKDTIK